jgi:capsular exopolysaccharide synthesis family protein
LGAIFLGLLIPLGIIYVRDLLDNKVHGLKDLEKFHLPSIGEIPFNTEKENIVALKHANTGISEAFRLMRTNINFMIDQSITGGKVIFITSTVAKEGKTFTSINLAHSIAHSGKKTVVVGLDLRAPKIKQYLDLTNNIGVSNYIVKSEITLDDITVHAKESENLDYIISGEIPPNPSELLMRDRLEELFTELRAKYDFIIVDTAPVGLVADTLHTSRLADIVLYVVRANLIDKRMLSIPQRLYKDKKLGNMAILVNGTDLKGKGYGYGYGYGYGQGYGDTIQKKKSFFSRLRK